jgi:hypothetical protein
MGVEEYFSAVKNRNAPNNVRLSGRTFLQEEMYHTIKFCQGKSLVFAKYFLFPRFQSLPA